MTGDEPMSINREDMMELTRRMTLSRNCFSRLAGAYMDEEGFIDGTFHTHFLKLSKAEQEKNLKLAKAIPFAKTNEQLKSHSIGSSSEFRKLLLALRECELKKDALLYNLYEYIGERHQPGYPYGIYVFYGTYDVPRKGTDHTSQWESEEVYQFLICAISPLVGEYEMGTPEAGFLFPAFEGRCAETGKIYVLE